MINELYKHAIDQLDYPLHALLMFTAEHAHVIKMLQDPAYYQALNEMTCNKIALFHTRLFQGRFEPSGSPKDTLALMVPIWKEPSENKQLLTAFEMEDSRELPCLVVFLFHDGFLQFAKSSIGGESKEDVFNLTSDIIKRLVSVVDKTESKLGSMENAKFVMKKINIKRGFKNFIAKLGTFRGAAGI